MKLTAKGAATRQRIVEGAAMEIRERGIQTTTLDDIRARTGTSKSQLFHYFPGGRDELLLAVARHEADLVLSEQQPCLSELHSWRAWQRWRDVVVERYRKQGISCPMQTLTSQLTSPGAQAVVTELLRKWESQIADGIREMQRQGKIDARLDPDARAAALLAGVQGGVLVLLATGSTRHLEAALDQGIQGLRETVAAAA